MKLNNEQVEHKSFGIGKIVKSSESYVEIEFSSGNKKFVFPDAFAKHLTLVNEKVGSIVDEMVVEKKKELQEEEEKLNEERDQLVKERQFKREQEKISKNQKSHNSLQAVFWCQDDELEKVLTEWEVFTGLIKSGAKEGQPNRLARLNTQSACLITTRDSDVEEKERRIRGIYMVRENFLGKMAIDGYIPAHSEYKLRLTDEESKKMLFWTYYINNRFPDKITWNTGRYRYFENVMVAQILKDIINLREDTEDKEFVQSFFDYFCNINFIDGKNLPEPGGTLVEIEEIEEIVE